MTTLVLVLLLAALPAQAQMYKCVDERGRIQYTDKPQAGCKESAIKPSPPLSGEVKPPKEDFAGQEADLKRRQIERDASAAQERQAQTALMARCAKLRDDYGTLVSGARIFSRNAEGERVFLDDATREQRIASLQQQLRACP